MTDRAQIELALLYEVRAGNSSETTLLRLANGVSVTTRGTLRVALQRLDAADWQRAGTIIVGDGMQAVILWRTVK